MKTKITPFLALLFATWGCNKTSIENPPKDFDVVLVEDYLGQVELSKDRLIRSVNGTDYKVRLSITSNEKSAIYNSVLNNGILDLPKKYHPDPKCDDLHQTFYHLKVIANNNVHFIEVSDCNYGFFENFKVKNCIDSINEIIKVVEKRKEVQEIPSSDALRM
jgi:hypothetical protein